MGLFRQKGFRNTHFFKVKKPPLIKQFDDNYKGYRFLYPRLDYHIIIPLMKYLSYQSIQTEFYKKKNECMRLRKWFPFTSVNLGNERKIGNIELWTGKCFLSVYFFFQFAY